MCPDRTATGRSCFQARSCPSCGPRCAALTDLSQLCRTSNSCTLRARGWCQIVGTGDDSHVDGRSHLRLVPLEEHNWRASLAVQISPEQLRFVSDHQPVALVILAKAYIRPGDLDWEPVAVTCEGSVVGVLALAHAPSHTELLHLAVDAGSQGQRVGSEAVALVVRHVMESRPRAEELRLTVHPDNERAQRLYRGAGFLPNGQMRDGEPVWVLSLNRGSASGPPPDRH